jgi:hypothetical protein
MVPRARACVPVYFASNIWRLVLFGPSFAKLHCRSLTDSPDNSDCVIPFCQHLLAVEVCLRQARCGKLRHHFAFDQLEPWAAALYCGAVPIIFCELLGK